MQTRAEALQWCKDRALAYCDQGDPVNAINSMISDMGKHPETEDHPAIKLAMMLMLMGEFTRPDKARDFINGFN